MEQLRSLFTVPTSPELLALLAWCSETRFGAVLQFTNVVIGLAYVSIPLAIVAYLRRRPDIEHRWLFWCFILFILGCGLTHFGHVLLLRDPTWFPAVVMVHLFTAAISAATAFALWPLLPLFARIPTPRQLMAMIRERDAAVGALGQRQDVLVKELNHRVRNNLQVLQGLLTLMIKDPGTHQRDPAELLGIVLSRIRAVARTHDRIYHGESAMPERVDTRDFIVGICADLAEQFGAAVVADVDAFPVPIDEATAMAMAVSELVTNAVKHGRRGAGAEIRVALKGTAASWTLTVADAGPGLPPGFEVTGPRASVGLRLIRGLAAQLGARLSAASTDTGATFTLAKSA